MAMSVRERQRRDAWICWAISIGCMAFVVFCSIISAMLWS